MMDVPNARSSHTTPTPRSGGIAIVATFFIGWAALWALGDDVGVRQSSFAVLAGAALVLAAVSIADDLGELGFRTKLLAQIAAAGALMAFGGVVDQITVPGVGGVALGWWGYPLTLVWIVGLTNAFNFMDGIDGIAAGTAVIAAGFFAAIAVDLGAVATAWVSAIVVFAALGFLLWNWPPAKIFMGDTGSQFLGFVLAGLAVMAVPGSGTGAGLGVPFWVMVVLFFHFIWDSAYTLVRRLRAGDNITQAHRSHLYQLMNRLGASHARVTGLYLLMGTLQGLGAVVLVRLDGGWQMAVLVPFVAVQWFVTREVTRRAREAGLIG